MNISVQKTVSKIFHTVEFDVNGGDTISFTSKTYTLGKTYESLPTATKEGMICVGWYTEATGGRKLTATSEVDFSASKLYAHYAQMTNYTAFNVTTTSNYKEFGFYSLTKKSASECVYVDWGDGTVEEFTESTLSQKYHTYSSVGSFIVKVSDDITQFCISYNTSTYYNKNRYVFRSMAALSTSITQLPAYCFYYCSYMSSLKNMNTITSIGARCFYNCTSLTSFTGLGNITSLPEYAFYGCSGIYSLDTLPTSVIRYGQYCLRNTNITDLSRIRATDTLDSYCFAGLKITSLATLTPRSSLPSYCFNNCSQLKTADMSNWTSMTYLPTQCFYRCTYLETFIAPSTLTSIGTYAFAYDYYGALTADLSNTQLTAIPDQCFYYSYALKEVKLPSTIKNIGSYVFYQCYNNLSSIELPSSLTSIGAYAFYQCSKLQQISCLAENAPTVQSTTFGNSTTYYTGRSTYSAGTNRLHVQNVDNYNTSYWQSVLLDSTKCGFKSIPLDYHSALGFEITGISASYEYTGAQITPFPTVVDKNGNSLTQDVDYAVSYSNNIDCGTATLSVTGIDPYYDAQALNFNIYDPSKICCIIDLNDQWRLSETQTNPYEDKLCGVYESYSNYNVNNGWAKMYVRLSGYTDFNLYIRSYAESTCDYTIAFNEDVDCTSLPDYNTTGVKAHTRGNQKSDQNLTSYTKVNYNLDGSEHFVCVVYRKDSSGHVGNDRGYLLVEQKQTAESGYRIYIDSEYDTSESNYRRWVAFTIDGGTTIVHGNDLDAYKGMKYASNVENGQCMIKEIHDNYAYIYYHYFGEAKKAHYVRSSDSNWKEVPLTADIYIDALQSNY